MAERVRENDDRQGRSPERGGRREPGRNRERSRSRERSNAPSRDRRGPSTNRSVMVFPTRDGDHIVVTVTIGMYTFSQENGVHFMA